MTRVLVVEDEESYREALSYMLSKEGFEVIEAHDGATGIAEFDRRGADIVLLDLMMPGLPGTEVCRQLRLRGPVPVIMLTARDSEVDKVVGLELGADDYVTKPFSHRELIARMRAVLRRGQDAELMPDVVEAGGVRMDVENSSVARGICSGELRYRPPVLLRTRRRARLGMAHTRLDCRDNDVADRFARLQVLHRLSESV